MKPNYNFLTGFVMYIQRTAVFYISFHMWELSLKPKVEHNIIIYLDNYFQNMFIYLSTFTI